MFGLKKKSQSASGQPKDASPAPAAPAAAGGSRIGALLSGRRGIIAVVVVLVLIAAAGAVTYMDLLSPAPPPPSAPVARPAARPVPVPSAGTGQAAADRPVATAAAQPAAQPAATGTATDAPTSPPSAGDPEEVYARLHAATLAGDMVEMRRNATAAKRAELEAIPKAQASAAVNLIGSMMPPTYKVTRKSIAEDGKTATLLATGTSEFGKQEMHGAVNFTREDGSWKVGEWSWTSDKPGAQPSAKAAESMGRASTEKTALATPAEEAKPAQSPAERRRAREEAAKLAEQERLAEEKRRQEAFNARCVIRPVMSDADIDRCRPDRK